MSKIFGGDKATATLAEAKDWLRLRGRKGAYCPCCNQYAKVYKRVLGSQMARWLIWLVRTWEQGQLSEKNGNALARRYGEKATPPLRTWAWIDVKQSPVRGGDYAKLLHWGLVEHKANTGDATKKDSGLWRPTHAGIAFVHRRSLMRSHVILYDNKLLNWSDDSITDITIVQALGNKFDYQELMSAPIRVEVPV